MIDLHNHILWDVDDGAADLAESLEIARQFVSEGVNEIVATPHLNPQRNTGPSALVVRGMVGELNQSLERNRIGLHVLPGNEIYLTPDLPELLQHGRPSALGSSTALLVECPFDQRPIYLEDTLFRLEIAGYVPVLAHPERYLFVQRDPSVLDPLVKRGIVLQLTAPSLLGEYGRVIQQTAERLLRRGAYALAASDRHHPGSTRSLADLHYRLVQRGGNDLADLLLCRNPANLLHGTRLALPPALPTVRRRFLSRLLREGHASEK